MKVLIGALLVLVILLGFGAYTYYYVSQTSAILVEKTTVLEKDVEAREWLEAQRSFTQLHSAWEKVSAKWTILLDHQELDNINITLSRISKFIDTRDLPGSTSEIAELKLLLNHIPEKEAVNLKNIL